MNKVVSWNVNGVGFDAREAAREAARRQGKSLGEWLHGVIADHASDIGVEADEIGSRQRIEAVTSKLERLSARSADHDRRLRAGRTDDLAKRRRDRERAEGNFDRDDRGDHEFRHRDRGVGVGIGATDPVLEEAIEAMERRALRAERRADEAMQSVNELLRRNETRRDHERESVADFAQKLTNIETRLTNGFAQAEDNPIKGALARLEARLDRIGRRGAAEASVRPQPGAAESPALPEPLQRLEDKLNTILDAVHGRSPAANGEASTIAMSAARAASGKDRRLGEAIAEIAKRQQALEGSNTTPAPLHDTLRRREGTRGLRRSEEPAGASTPFAAMRSEISALASKIEGLHRDWAEQPRKAAAAVDLDGLRSEITTMSDMLRELAPQGRVAQLEDSVRGLTQRLETSFDPGRRDTMLRSVVSTDEVAAGSLRVEPSDVDRIQDQMREIRDLVEASTAKPLGVERIEQQIAALNDRFDRPTRDLNLEAAAGRPSLDAPYELGSIAAQSEPSTLEALVRDLSRKMEAARAPDANRQAFDALQDQIAALASRFERSDSGLAKLASLEKSMRELFVHLDETRTSVETSAARAAREVLRIAMEEGRAHTEQGTVTSLATMQALQDEAESRTESTLSAVHDTLEKVVDRLAVMETEIADVRARKPAPAPAERSTKASVSQSGEDAQPGAKAMSLGSADRFLDQVLGQRAPEASRKRKENAKAGERDVPADLDAEAGRSDFIAAARRAAKAAQTDASLADFKLSATAKAGTPVRANLIAQSRDYVARHKRPVLLSIAALFVIVGTMAVMQRIGLGGNDVQTADAKRSTTASRMVVADPQPARRSAELTPSALPKNGPPLANPIPGSDPIQTGSIPSLPAFAAQGAASMAPRPTLPARLKTMANAGDGDAEYVLATQYAEGRVVPRDFKLAASWYQKAADQGIVPAQYRLASLYEKGLGVAPDKAKAKSLYIRAAEAGNPRAMHNLAVLLADGDGKPDYEGAATWFRKAAQYGIHDSQYNLAILLARGLGTQQSLVQSYQWFAIAAAQNDSDAAKKRDEVGTKLNANDLAVAKALAASFHARIADIAATDVQPPPGGWDGASTPSPVNSARAKISSL